MNEPQSKSELLMSLNILFPDALESGKRKDYTGKISEKLQQVISDELDRLKIRHSCDSVCFHYLGTKIVPDSTRCSDCGTWVIPDKHAHITSVVSSGYLVDDDRILCDQCWSLFEGEKKPLG